MPRRTCEIAMASGDRTVAGRPPNSASRRVQAGGTGLALSVGLLIEPGRPPAGRSWPRYPVTNRFAEGIDEAARVVPGSVRRSRGPLLLRRESDQARAG